MREELDSPLASRPRNDKKDGFPNFTGMTRLLSFPHPALIGQPRVAQQLFGANDNSFVTATQGSWAYRANIAHKCIEFSSVTKSALY